MANSESLDTIVLRAGKFDTDHGSGLPGLKKIFDRIAAERPERVVIYFHGGLVSREAGEAAAAHLAPYYKQSGAEPIFVIWETGAFEVIAQQLEAAFKENIFQRILRRVTQFVRGKFDKELGPGGAKGPDDDLPLRIEADIHAEIEKGKVRQPMFSDLPLDQLSPNKGPTPDEGALTAAERRQITEEIEGDILLQDQLIAIADSREEPSAATAKGLKAPESTTSLMDPEVINDIAPVRPGAKSILSTIALAKHIATVVGAVIWRFANKRDHGVYLTLIEEILREFYVRAAGKFLWDGMKTEIDQAFQNDANCGGTALVESLHALWRSRVKPQVILVGHSAGAIYVSRFVKELNAKMDDDFTLNVVLIAPACTFNVFADALRVAGHRIAGLRVFGMGDTIELNDALVPIVYPASLLYFVSGVLEENRDEPLAGMQRYYSPRYQSKDFEDIESVRAFPYLIRDHAFAWSQIADYEGAKCDMVSHGGWGHAQQTRDSVMYIVKKGFGDA
jgi:hypothetical protein